MKKQNQRNNQGQQKQLKDGNRTQSKPKKQQKNYNYHKQVYYHSKCDYYIPLFWIYKILAETQQNQLDIKLIGCQCQILRAQFLQVIKDKCILCGQDYNFEKISLNNDAIFCFLCNRSHEKSKNQQNQENPLRKFKFKKQALQYVESLLSKCMSCDKWFKKSQKYTNQQNEINIILCQKCCQLNLKSIQKKPNCIKYIKFNNNDKNESKNTQNEAKRNQTQINNNQNEKKYTKAQEKINTGNSNNNKAELQKNQKSNSKEVINVNQQVKIQKDEIKSKNKQEKQEKLNQTLETTAANLSNLSFEQNSLISENIETFRRKIKSLEVKADQNSSIMAYQNKKLVQQQKQQKQQLLLISKNEESMRVMENKMNKKMQLLIKQYQKMKISHINGIQQNNRLSNANKQLMNESQELRNASKKLINANKELTIQSKEQIQAHQEVMNAHKQLIDANREVINTNKELMNENRDLKEKYAEKDAHIHALSNSFNQFKDETKRDLLKIASQQKIINSIINPQNPQNPQNPKKQMLQYYLYVPDSFSESKLKQPLKQQQIININQNSQSAEDNGRKTNVFSIGSCYEQNINPKYKLVRLIIPWNDKTSWGGSQYGQRQDVRMEKKEMRREEKEVRMEKKEVRMEEKQIEIERKAEQDVNKKKNGNIQVSSRSNTELVKKNQFLQL